MPYIQMDLGRNISVNKLEEIIKEGAEEFHWRYEEKEGHGLILYRLHRTGIIQIKKTPLKQIYLSAVDEPVDIPQLEIHIPVAGETDLLTLMATNDLIDIGKDNLDLYIAFIYSRILYSR